MRGRCTNRALGNPYGAEEGIFASAGPGDARGVAALGRRRSAQSERPDRVSAAARVARLGPPGGPVRRRGRGARSPRSRVMERHRELAELQRDWRPPVELSGSSSREVELSAGGMALASPCVVLMLGAIASIVFLSREASRQAGDATRELFTIGRVVDGVVTRRSAPAAKVPIAGSPTSSNMTAACTAARPTSRSGSGRSSRSVRRPRPLPARPAGAESSRRLADRGMPIWLPPASRPYWSRRHAAGLAHPPPDATAERRPAGPRPRRQTHQRPARQIVSPTSSPSSAAAR